MGTGLCKAVYLVFPGIRDFVCHFHFLRDAGKDLLEPSYGQLRKTLQKHAATTRLGEIIRDLHRRIENHALDTRHLTAAITKGHALENMNLTSLASIYSLCLWCLQGKKEGKRLFGKLNNLLEQFFRGLRRNHRRKTGNNFMRGFLHAMLADTPLIKNLGNPEYMGLLLNGKKNLEELFAEIEINGHEPISSTSHPDRVLPGFRKLIKMDNLPGKIQLTLEKCS